MPEQTKAQLIEEIRAIEKVLGKALVVSEAGEPLSDEQLASMKKEDLQYQVDFYGDLAARVAKQIEDNEKLKGLLAQQIASGAMATATPLGLPVQVPKVAPCDSLIVRSLTGMSESGVRGHSHTLQILPTYTDRDGNVTVMGFSIFFPDDQGFIWRGEAKPKDDQFYQLGAIPGPVINFYGGLANVIGLIKDKVENMPAGQYEIIDHDKFQSLLAEEGMVAFMTQAVKDATQNPHLEASKALFEFLKSQNRGKTKIVVQGPVTG